MKNTIRTISTILQYAATVFLALLTMGAFLTSFPSGVVLLLSTLLACPFTRNNGIKLIQKISKDKLPIEKIKGWMYAVASFVLMIIALLLSPTSESNNQAQGTENVVQIETADEQENTELIEETLNETENTDILEDSQESESEESVVAKVESEEVTATEVEEVKETIVAETKAEEVEPSTSNIEVHFIDVGQGDATLIKADEQYMLIDAGENDKGTAVQLYLQKQGVQKLDYLILTHTDADHIGGADVIVTKFDIDTVFMGDFKKDNKTYEELISAFDYKGLNYSIPEVGSEYKIGNATFTIVAPNDTYSDPNNSSIALVLRNGDNSFLFTGDCEEEAESDIVSNGINIDCDVYKLGHHGSKTASSQNFLNAVTPIYGVISCEEGNSYGHPHAEPLNNLRAMGVQIFRTDEQGSIIAYSDGAEITWNCAPSDTWQVGENTQSSVESEKVETPVVQQEAVAEEPKVEPQPEPQVVVAEEPAQEPEPTPTPEPSSGGSGSYAVNGNNGKIHIVGACPATGTGKNAMKNPVYFNAYEEAEAYSIQYHPEQDKRKCGNCW